MQYAPGYRIGSASLLIALSCFVLARHRARRWWTGRWKRETRRYVVTHYCYFERCRRLLQITRSRACHLFILGRGKRGSKFPLFDNEKTSAMSSVIMLEVGNASLAKAFANILLKF